MPAQTEEWLGKSISEMISEDTYVAEDGSVYGTLYYVTGYTQFNESETDQQEGWYFPLKLTQTGTTMDLEYNGNPNKTGLTFDPEILLRVIDSTGTWTIKVDNTEVVTLNFVNATLEPKE